MSVKAPERDASLGELCRDLLAALIAEPAGTLDEGLAQRLNAIQQAPSTGSDKALAQLAEKLELTQADLFAASFCLEVERDPIFARQVALIQEPVGQARPLIGLLARLCGEIGADVAALASGKAIQSGLLAMGDEAAPLTERSLFMERHTALALAGTAVASDDFRLLEDPALILSQSQLASADRLAQSIASAENAGGTILLRSSARNECLAMAHHIARALGSSLAVTVREEIAPHAAWFAALDIVPLFKCSKGVGEQWSLPDVHGYAGPKIVVANPDVMVSLSGAVLEHCFAVPDQADREALWRANGVDKATAKRAAQSYRQGAARIGELAAAINPLDKQSTWDQLRRIVQSRSHDLGISAHYITPGKIERDALVLEEDLRTQIDQLIAHIRHRDTLADDLGPAIAGRYRPGVTALMCGESGTGKTLAVHWLADQIGLPLYRVDMAALTSKWIGETEKNLSRLLDVAESSDLILFFDEADSLFGARTDVSDSNDRFANAQTNFLLQRIEEFDGIAILSTNSRDRFDSAFVRRLDAILEFPLPDAQARRELWVQHLGDQSSINADDLDQLAVNVDLVGGHIRNVVVQASAMAQSNSRAIELHDILHAVRSEYAKLGKPSDIMRER